MPAWARPIVEGIAEEIVDGLRSSPVRIVGDLSLLTPKAREGHDPVMPEPPQITGEITARIATGALAASGVLSWDTLAVGATELPPLLPAAASDPRPRAGAGRPRPGIRAPPLAQGHLRRTPQQLIRRADRAPGRRAIP